MAIQAKKVEKTYLVILEGDLDTPVCVDKPIARRRGGPVFVKSEVSFDRTSQTAVTHFKPLIQSSGYTLCKVIPETGRKHQIRVHAEWLKKRVVGDKIYGPDETLYIDFIEQGWTDRLEAALPMKRQALHCYHYVFNFSDRLVSFMAPVQQDMLSFCKSAMNIEKDEIQKHISSISAD